MKTLDKVRRHNEVVHGMASALHIGAWSANREALGYASENPGSDCPPITSDAWSAAKDLLTQYAGCNKDREYSERVGSESVCFTGFSLLPEKFHAKDQISNRLAFGKRLVLEAFRLRSKDYRFEGLAVPTLRGSGLRDLPEYKPHGVTVGIPYLGPVDHWRGYSPSADQVVLHVGYSEGTTWEDLYEKLESEFFQADISGLTSWGSVGYADLKHGFKEGESGPCLSAVDPNVPEDSEDFVAVVILTLKPLEPRTDAD